MLRRKTKHPKHANLKAKLPKSRRPINKVNPVRRAREFARCYGSKARVAFIKTLACVVCGATPSDNAHIHGSKAGMGRKGPYTDIVPLCRSCHTRYDEYTLKLDPAGLRLVADALEMYTSWTLPRSVEDA
jgi:5-methylcytosine-specific restriction endonuclease McrA